MYTAMRKGVKTHHLICEQITAHAATGELLVIACPVDFALERVTLGCQGAVVLLGCRRNETFARNFEESANAHEFFCC